MATGRTYKIRASRPDTVAEGPTGLELKAAKWPDTLVFYKRMAELIAEKRGGGVRILQCMVMMRTFFFVCKVNIIMSYGY